MWPASSTRPGLADDYTQTTIKVTCEKTTHALGITMQSSFSVFRHRRRLSVPARALCHYTILDHEIGHIKHAAKGFNFGLRSGEKGKAENCRRQ